MEKIKSFLISNGYDIYSLDNTIEGDNEFLHILIVKKKMKKNTF